MHANTSTKFKITLTDKYMAVEEGDPTFEDLLFSTVNAILNEAHRIHEHYLNSDDDSVKEQADVAKGAVFDMMNLAFSNALHAFDPTVDLHPELTPESMLEAENALLDESLLNCDTDTFSALVEGDANSYEEIQRMSEV